MPTFKTNLEIQQNQLMQAVLENSISRPDNPVEGQLYYDTGKKTAYLWDGSYWEPLGSSSGGSGDIKQFTLNIPNPAIGTSMAFSRLYQDLLALRVDAHFSTENIINFNIDIRQNVNEPGTNITDRPMQATYNSTETTTIDHTFLKKDDWLFLTVVRETGGEVTPIEGETGGTTGEGGTTPPAGDGEVLGILTVVITCTTDL